MKAVQKAVWYIETHLNEPFSLDAAARAAGISNAYLSRSFKFALGLSPSEFARGRRLSAAVSQLVESEKDIMSVALDAGYGSHEAFTRAFRKFFGATPESVRASQSVNTLNLLEAKTMTDLPDIELSPPEIATRGPLIVAGLKRRFKFSERGSIPGLWQEFIPLMLQVPDIRPGATYGVVTGGLMGEDGFDYAAAVEIKQRDDAPKGLEAIDIPKQRYAIFRHGGHVSEIGAVCSAVFGDWASQTGEALSDGAIQLLEHYPPCFDAMTGNGGFEIWLPLKG